MAIDEYCGELETTSKEWDQTVVKELLRMSHLGDYVRIHHTGYLIRWRKKVTEGYILAISLIDVMVGSYNPLDFLMKTPFFSRTRIIELDTILAYTRLPTPKND